MNNMKRVAIIGAEMLNHYGVGTAKVLQKENDAPAVSINKEFFKDKKIEVGISRLTGVDTKTLLPGISIRCIDNTTINAGIVTKMLLDKFDEQGLIEHSKIGMALGSAFGSVASINSFDVKAITEGPNSVNPMEFPNTVSNAPTSKVGIWFGLKGTSITISNGLTSGIDAIGLASDEISCGKLNYYVAGSSEELSDDICTCYSNQIIDGQSSNSDWSGSEVLGDGSGVVFLCSMNEAISKKYQTYGEIIEFKTIRIAKEEGFGTAVCELISNLLKINNIKKDDVLIYASYLPFNRYSKAAIAEVEKEFGSDVLFCLNRKGNLTMNYLSNNGVFNLITALNNNQKKNILVFEIDCDKTVSCLLVTTKCK